MLIFADVIITKESQKATQFKYEEEFWKLKDEWCESSSAQEIS